MTAIKTASIHTVVVGIITAFISYWLGYLTYIVAVKTTIAHGIINTFMCGLATLFFGWLSLIFGVITFILAVFMLYVMYEEIIKG